MKLCEYLHVLKSYLAPELSVAEFFDRVFGYCLTDEGADIACGYGRVQKHYFYTGEAEPCYLAAKVLKYFDDDSFSRNLYDEIEQNEVPDMVAEFGEYGLTINEEEWDATLVLALKDILKRSRDECRSIRVRGKIQVRASLMEENPNGICPCTHCSNQLVLFAHTDDQLPSLLQAVYLDEEGPKNESNAIGVCAECVQKGDFDVNALREKKKEFLRMRKAYAELDDPLFPERLTLAANKLKSVKLDRLKPLSYKALSVNKKIHSDNGVLLEDIEDKVMRFFPFLLECFSCDDGLGNYSYNRLSESIRAIYESADAECATQNEVFDAISQKIAAVVDGTPIIGRVIAAYFVQTCEVFNEVS